MAAANDSNLDIEASSKEPVSTTRTIPVEINYIKTSTSSDTHSAQLPKASFEVTAETSRNKTSNSSYLHSALLPIVTSNEPAVTSCSSASKSIDNTVPPNPNPNGVRVRAGGPVSSRPSAFASTIISSSGNFFCMQHM
jgi:hypothetical protein